ncbi:DUF4209 domain-containing protein [Clostridium estertheticum]|uniref:DUF4209 domain-containing protein n=1 Tax=Clostridium estertheticum TaxID=238834 RepID=UPI0013E95FA0|nr:DUF4209 domain-containing protein [Clostridium estertheticum]MBZ9686810.1 DUF4209 domain-containing protein [Clostridium estertheticum]
MNNIEYKEIEQVITELIIEKGIDEINKKHLEEQGFGGIYAKTEENISYVLCHIITPDFNEDEMKYIISAAERFTSPLLKTRYYAVLVECSCKKEKYERSKKLVEYVLVYKNEIFNETRWTIFDLDLLNLLLFVSSTMRISKFEIANLSLDYVEKNGCLSNIVIKLLLIIKGFDKPEDRDKTLIRTESIYINIIYRLSKVNDVIALGQLLQQIQESGIKFINVFPLERAISRSSLNLAKCGARTLREISFAQKASEIAKKIKDNELEKESLAVLHDLISNNEIVWSESKFELPEKENQKINKDIIDIKAYFSKAGGCIQNRIKALSSALSINYYDSEGKIISSSLFYRPLASFSDIKAFVQSFENQSSLARIATISTLGDGKVVNTGFNPLIQAKSQVYTLHALTNILPAIDALESSDDFTMDAVREYVMKSKYITKEDIDFIYYAFDDYATKRYIPFIHVIVPCIESIIRNIYKNENGTDIQAKDNDNTVQTTVNLSDVLKNSRFIAKITENVHEYLIYFLNEETGENIRNNVAHRLKNAEYYNEYRSKLLMHILTLLSSIE